MAGKAGGDEVAVELVEGGEGFGAPLQEEEGGVALATARGGWNADAARSHSFILAIPM